MSWWTPLKEVGIEGRVEELAMVEERGVGGRCWISKVTRLWH